MTFSAREIYGELLGTFLLTLFGCGSVAVTTLFEAHQGLLQIALVWGIGVTLAIYITRHLSSAHLNPAVSIAMVISGRMKGKKLISYILSQFTGAFLAGLVLYLLFSPSIAAFENSHHIIRGTAASIKTAAMFGEYYGQPDHNAVVSLPLAISTEAFGTFLLVMTIFALTEECNVGKPDASLTPVFIGLTVTAVICLLAPLTQAGLNPARDFGPRLVAWMMGWKSAAFPDHQGGFFFVYILGPILGSLAASMLFTRIGEKLMRKNDLEQQHRVYEKTDVRH